MNVISFDISMHFEARSYITGTYILEYIKRNARGILINGRNEAMK